MDRFLALLDASGVGRVIAKQPGPGRPPNISDCLAGQLYHRAGYPSFAGVFS